MSCFLDIKGWRVIQCLPNDQKILPAVWRRLTAYCNRSFWLWVSALYRAGLENNFVMSLVALQIDSCQPAVILFVPDGMYNPQNSTIPSLKKRLLHKCVFKNLFWYGSFLKSLLNLFNTVCLMFWLFGCKACGILNPQPRIEPVSPALEGDVLTTKLPGKSHKCDL